MQRLRHSHASAQTKVEIDGIWYNLIAETKQAEVTFKSSSSSKNKNEYTGPITIPATVNYEGDDYSVTSIGSSAFYKCSSLTTINIPESVTSIGISAFVWCTSLTTITLPEGVTSIESCAFFSCTSLTSITIPEGVTSIEERTFYGCESLTAINIPEGVTSIGKLAFYYCESLTAIVLPKNLREIGSQAFADCNELLDVYCYAESVPWAEANAFDGSYPEYATLHVPASALNTYKTTAPWNSFGTIVALTEKEMSIEQLTSDKSLLIIYDLSGRRVEKAEKGIYIINGKKTIVK